MLKFVTFLSFGLIFLIFYYYYGKIKAGRFIFKKTFVGKIARRVAPKENSKDYIKIFDKLNKAMSSLDVIDITAIKISALLATIILAVSVFFTNVSLQKAKIYNTPVLNSYEVTSTYNNALLREKNVKIINKNIGLKNICNDNNSLEIIKKILANASSISNNELDQVANSTMKDILKIKSIYTLPKLLIYLLVAFSGTFIIDLIMLLYFNIRETRIKEESTKLMNILTIVLSTSSIPVNLVITILIDNSNYLKEILQKFFISYMVNSEESYKLYLVKTQNKSFEKLIGMLKQIEDSDQEEAIRNIKNQNENEKVLKRLEFENIMQKKDGIALVVLTVGVVFLIKFVMDFCMIAMNTSGSMKI